MARPERIIQVDVRRPLRNPPIVAAPEFLDRNPLVATSLPSAAAAAAGFAHGLLQALQANVQLNRGPTRSHSRVLLRQLHSEERIDAADSRGRKWPLAMVLLVPGSPRGWSVVQDTHLFVRAHNPGCDPCCSCCAKRVRA